jgi:hypothetical protein
LETVSQDKRPGKRQPQYVKGADEHFPQSWDHEICSSPTGVGIGSLTRVAYETEVDADVACDLDDVWPTVPPEVLKEAEQSARAEPA